MAARRERGLFDPDGEAGGQPVRPPRLRVRLRRRHRGGHTHEASSLAAHQELGNLILIYDDNHISIEDDTLIAKSENVAARYEAYGWHVQHVDWVQPDGSCTRTSRPSTTR